MVEKVQKSKSFWLSVYCRTVPEHQRIRASSELCWSFILRWSWTRSWPEPPDRWSTHPQADSGHGSCQSSRRSTEVFWCSRPGRWRRTAGRVFLCPGSPGSEGKTRGAGLNLATRTWSWQIYHWCSFIKNSFKNCDWAHRQQGAVSLHQVSQSVE